MSETLQVTGMGLPKPILPKKPRKPSLMSAAEADAAAIDAGFVTVRAKQLKGCAALGEYGTQLGALYVARGIYLYTFSQIQRLVEQADNLISKNPEPEVEAGVIATKDHLVESLLKTAGGIVESCKIDIKPPATAAPSVMPGFGPNIQVNVNTPTPPALPPAEIPVAVKTDAE